MQHNKIIAVDFDGTLCENKWPEIGAANEILIQYLIRVRATLNTKVILWTNRSGDILEAAVKWCNKQGLYFDAVNENLPEIIEKFGGDTRKIFANEYIDDRMSTQFELPFVKDKPKSKWKNQLCKFRRRYFKTSSAIFREEIGRALSEEVKQND